MSAACLNDNIGYDQSNRLDVIAQIKKYGSMAKIAVKTEADCGTLVRGCCIEAGFDPGNFTTANEVVALARTGKFEDKVSVTASTVLYNGDVLATKTKGHTAIVVSGNPRKDKENDSEVSTAIPTYALGKVYTTQVELKVRTGPGTNYPAKKHGQLSTDGQKHDADKNGALDPGTKVTCKEVARNGADIWIKSPSGWLAAFYKGKVYIR